MLFDFAEKPSCTSLDESDIEPVSPRKKKTRTQQSTVTVGHLPAKLCKTFKTSQYQQKNTVTAEQFALPAQPPTKLSKTFKTPENQQQNTVSAEQFTLPAEPPAFQSDDSIQPLPPCEELSSSSGDQQSLLSAIASLDGPECSTVPPNRNVTTDVLPSSSSTPQRLQFNQPVRTPTSGISGSFI